MNDLRFFNPYVEIRRTKNRLPHWQQAGAVYFITFRLADAIPTNLRVQWQEERAIWLRFHPEPWTHEVEQEYHERFSGTMERWLDSGYGSCVLRRQNFREHCCRDASLFRRRTSRAHLLGRDAKSRAR